MSGLESESGRAPSSRRRRTCVFPVQRGGKNY